MVEHSVQAYPPTACCSTTFLPTCNPPDFQHVHGTRSTLQQLNKTNGTAALINWHPMGARGYGRGQAWQAAMRRKATPCLAYGRQHAGRDAISTRFSADDSGAAR